MPLLKPRYPKLQTGLPLARGIVGAWLFGEGGGNTLTDMSGRGAVGEVTTKTIWCAGDTGPALSFTGSTDANYVNIPRFNRVFTEATFLVLMKWDNTTPVVFSGILFSRGANVTGMGTPASGTTLGYTWNDAADTYTWNSGLNLVNGVWCVYAVSVAPTKAVAYIGVPGGGLTSAVNSVTHASTTINALMIARDYFENRNIRGIIGGAMIFDRALTESEIRALLTKDFFLAFRQPRRRNYFLAGGAPATYLPYNPWPQSAPILAQ